MELVNFSQHALQSLMVHLCAMAHWLGTTVCVTQRKYRRHKNVCNSSHYNRWEKELDATKSWEVICMLATPTNYCGTPGL